ncbi:hypothetical protein Pfo_027439 [Paulownia fortunei]|nr:hypothetical protein Pfo_027439 [Paulownia fortunei]
MSKKLLSFSEITHLLETDEFASSTPCSTSSYSFTSNIVPVMVTNATTLEEQIASLMKAIEGLTKHVQEQDSQITKLMNKVDNVDVSRVMGKQVEVHDEEKPSTQEFQVSSDGMIPVDQLKEFIMGTIKDKFDGSSKSSLTYVKPYTQRIDNLKMTVGYQPPKFQQFDSKGNPKQHVAHFIETYNDAGTYGDYLVKQFVHSLKGNAFDWYTNLEANSIDSWEYTRRTVSMIELTNSHQWKEEPVIDYINRWRNLSLNYKNRLSKASTIEMCIQEMHWGFQYILQGIQPRTFEELATRAHDMELSMAASRVEGPPIQEPQRSKESSKKESMAVNIAPIKFKDNTNDKSENLIELPEMKRPEEAGRIDDPKYCKYHRLVGHPIHDCFIFKDKKDNATVNLITIEFGSIDVIMENVPRCSDGGKLDYDNNISCNMTSEQKISSNEVYLFENEVHNVSDDYVLAVTFTDEDLLLGSAVNILPLRTLKELGISMDELANSRLMIQGFNQGGKGLLAS